ncbi:hypothetical protein EIP86_008850 [Pleurotus ostreatoroseus]|nr:hypothetical protein EIP86_008850 [Pleurotus ostreatoroseus]
MNTVVNTVEGTWHASPSSSSCNTSSQIDLEAQVTLGQRESIFYMSSPAPVRTTAPHAQGVSNPVDDFFGGVSSRGTHDSRHDERRTSLYGDVPPPYSPRDAQGLPSYSSVAEPPTLAMYLFKAGFLGWESSKSEVEREELLVCMRKTELKWAKRCAVAISVLALVIAAIVVFATIAKRS